MSRKLKLGSTMRVIPLREEDREPISFVVLHNGEPCQTDSDEENGEWLVKHPTRQDALASLEEHRECVRYAVSMGYMDALDDIDGYEVVEYVPEVHLAQWSAQRL